MYEDNMEVNLEAQRAVPEIKPPIVNGVVKRVNLDKDILENYEGDVNVDGNITATGYVRGSAAGQTLHTALYTFTGGEVTNSSDTYTDFASVNYSPVSESSYVLVEYHATYAVDGGGNDTFRSRITVNGTEITWRNQSWSDGNGQDVRGSVLFPISMVYANDAMDSLNIKVSAARDGSDDDLTVNTNSAYLRITEIAR